MSSVRTALRLGQVRTLALLFAGYAACYYCRADLSVATPLLVDELGRHGLSHGEALIRIGTLTSLGVLAYALGKLFLTGLGDYWGGRRNFLIGVGGAAVFTLMFAAGGTVPVFTIAWLGNRLTQSLGWAGLIKVSSKWFNYSSYGSIIGILSISYLVGDALARQQMGLLIGHGYGWRAVFLFAGVVAAVMLLANLLWLRESRVEAGHAEATPNPLNLFAATESPPASIRALQMYLGLTATAGAQLLLMSLRPGATSPLLPLAAIGLVAFSLLGPYSYLGGAFALDFGGKQASAASSGIIDGIGYLGGVLAGDGVARVAVAFGWDGVFVTLAAVSAAAALCAGALYLLNTRAVTEVLHA